ncbi:MAG TPA: hypothetical protein VI319_07985 [Burkholderiales bacterium]
MQRRGNEYDVSCKVNTTDSAVVNGEVDRIFHELYPEHSPRQIDQAFHDIGQLYRGAYPGFHACDTPYHDVQHVMDVTLAMARLIDGYERGRIGAEPVDASMFQLGVIVALFHDCGYVRALDDKLHKNGGELTLTHVSRGAQFLRQYLPKIGMGDVAEIAASLIHFTGYEMPISHIKVPSLGYKLLGSLLGSADIVAQMSDRCYLEKCRDRLYPEFVHAGIARRRLPDGKEEVVYASGADLVLKTPRFYQGAARRLESDLGGTHVYAERHFGGQDLYLEEVEKNIQFAEDLADRGDADALKRNPPVTQAGHGSR